ncbi:MAG: SUMF1/EgtB/PvdO family nonheme iron enzyme [Prevotellaceae bacterium]|jgi:gliding motility-associated lipoprotein GldJ|nr:SUMF1/EgtB/PvdO family nonheme iron enzyme [Prevotellaceae bacterium]
MKLKFLPLIYCILALSLTGCFLKKKSSGVSETTGWKYNDREYGGFEVLTPRKQATAPGLVFIEGGLYVMGRVVEDLGFTNNNTQRRVTVDSYYIDETEVRNVDYRMYIHWLGRTYVSYPNVVQNALPDSLVWRSPMSYNEPMVETYFRHVSFDNYPVVGVTWRQASDYCLWRTDRVNELQLVKKGILKLDLASQKDENNFNTDAYLAGQYEGTINKGLKDISSEDKNATRRVQMSDGILFSKYRLPTEAEWEFAAAGLIGVTENERVTERKVYPWAGGSVRSNYKKTRGQMMANFQRGKGDLMGVAGNANDAFATPAPVRSFYPNDYGLYCMAGNVNEWVLDVYRPLSFNDMDEFKPFRGNVYTQLVVDSEGKPVQKDQYGRMVFDTIGYTPDRFNYQTGDLRNYNDGDYKSLMKDIPAGENPEILSQTSDMYYQGEGELGKGRTSLISDKSRVYKGGSFLDRAYWLSPSTRRFLDEDKSACDIGFRCAMNMVGTKSDQMAASKKRKNKNN